MPEIHPDWVAAAVSLVALALSVLVGHLHYWPTLIVTLRHDTGRDDKHFMLVVRHTRGVAARRIRVAVRSYPREDNGTEYRIKFPALRQGEELKLGLLHIDKGALRFRQWGAEFVDVKDHLRVCLRYGHLWWVYAHKTQLDVSSAEDMSKVVDVDYVSVAAQHLAEIARALEVTTARKGDEDQDEDPLRT